MMTVFEWAAIGLPVLALMVALLVIYRNCAAIDEWIRMLDGWLETAPVRRPDTAPIVTHECNLRGADL